ncbi:MAG: peptidoglycan DD-metalloendopeptidase family protein [Pseudomonadota bacterium]
MGHVSIIISGDRSQPKTEFHIRKIWVTLFYVLACVSALLLGVGLADYIQLLKLQDNYTVAITENQQLKGEAQILMTNLEDLKKGLFRVEEFAGKLDSLVQSQDSAVKSETGIDAPKPEKHTTPRKPVNNTRSWPLGISIDSLIFRPLVENIQSAQSKSELLILDLQTLLSKIQAHSSLLAALPVGKPVEGWVASIFGYRVSPFTGMNSSHQGIDIAAPIGTPVLAPADGVVIYSGTKEGFGNFLMIAHGYGVVTRYGHNSALLVKVGQRITKGEQIAAVGDTGRSTGPHLHYEIWVNGRVVNPNRYLLGNF